MWCTSTQPASARRPETRWRFHLSRCPGFGVHFSVNQWQRIEVVSQGGVLKNYLNGTLVSTAELLEDLDPGYIGLQSQGGPVEWRNIRLREE